MSIAIFSFLQREQVTAGVVETSRRLGEIAARRGQTLAQMSLAWLLRDERVTSVIIGARNVAQMDCSLKTLDNTAFSSQEIMEIDKITEKY